MKRIARPIALVLTVSVLCFLLPQPLLAQPYLAKVTETAPTIRMSPEKEIAVATEAKQETKSKKGLLWGLLGLVGVVGIVAAVAGGGSSGGGGGKTDNPPSNGSGGISASW
jgi:hypothetical protein